MKHAYGWLRGNRMVWKGGLGSGGESYSYGWPSGGSSESDVVFQVLYNETSSPVVDVVQSFNIPCEGTPTFEQAATGPWAGLSPGIDFYSGRARDYTNTPDADWAIGTSDFTFEWVMKLDSRAPLGAPYPIIGFMKHDDARGIGVLAYRRNPSACYIRCSIITEDSTSVHANHFVDTLSDVWVDGEIHKYRWTGDRDGSSELFVDGVTQGTTAVLAALDGKTIPVKAVQAAADSGGGQPTFPGVLYESRVSKNLTNNSGGPGGG